MSNTQLCPRTGNGIAGGTAAGLGPAVEVAMSFGIYLAGFVVLIAGLAIGAHLLHVSNQWIGVGVLVLVGLGIVKGVARTRQRDPS
jgi:hypothetical protein